MVSNYKELFLNMKNLGKLIGFTFQWSVGVFIFTVITINLQNLGLPNIHVNGIFIGVATLVGSGTLVFFVTKINRKTGLRISFLVIIIGGVVLFICNYFFRENLQVEFLESLVSAFLFKGSTDFMFI